MQQENSKRKAVRRTKRRKRLLKWIAIYLFLLLAVVAAVLVWNYIENSEKFDRYQFDTAAMEGRIQTMTEEEIQRELNRVVEEGMFNISIASAIVFENPQAQGQARIENIQANRYHMQVDIVLDETGETVYSSKLIRPGYSIEYIQLEEELEPGVYDATAVFSAITQEEVQLFGQAAAQIKLHILRPEPTPTPTPTPSPTPVP